MTNKEFKKSVMRIAEQYKDLYDSIVIDRVKQIVFIGDVFFAQGEDAELMFDELEHCPKNIDEKQYLLWYLDGAGVLTNEEEN
jgi:hypothetical protein